MSNPTPNVRRVIRATRLLEELGHKGDSLAALEELVQARTRIADLERRLQEAAGERGVMLDILRDCDQVIGTIDPESADEGEQLERLLLSIKRLTVLRQADERDLIDQCAAPSAAAAAGKEKE